MTDLSVEEATSILARAIIVCWLKEYGPQALMFDTVEELTCELAGQYHSWAGGDVSSFRAVLEEPALIWNKISTYFPMEIYPGGVMNFVARISTKGELREKAFKQIAERGLAEFDSLRGQFPALIDLITKHLPLLPSSPSRVDMMGP